MIKITNYIDDICDLLKISKPIISYDTSTFESYTMLAQYDPENSTIYMRKPLAVTTAPTQPDYLFAIAHELRHVWQIRYHNDYFFEKYKNGTTCCGCYKSSSLRNNRRLRLVSSMENKKRMVRSAATILFL